AFGIVQWSHDQARIQFTGVNDCLLYVFVHRCFFCRDKARPHIYAFSPECQRGHQAACIGHASGSNKWYGKFFGGTWQENEIGHIVLTRMSCAFETVNAHRVATDPLGLARVTHRSAFMNDLDAVVLQLWQPFLRIVARSLDDFHTPFDNRIDITWIIGFGDSRQKGQVHTEGFVGQFVTTRNFLGQHFRSFLGQCRDDTESAGVGDSRSQISKTDMMHPPLDDGIPNGKEFGDMGPQLYFSLNSLVEITSKPTTFLALVYDCAEIRKTGTA